MKKLILCLCLLVSPLCLYGQGVLVNLPPITNSYGQPIAGATVSVFTASGSSTNLTCGAAQAIFSNVGLTIPINPLATNTATTDGFGNFPFYISPVSQTYGYTVTGQGTNTTICYGFVVQVTPGSSPTFSALTVTGAATVGTTLGVTGAVTAGSESVSGNVVVGGGTSGAPIGTVIVGGGQPWVDVQAPPWNAACNGVSTDDAAIQGALTAMSAKGGRVMLPVGKTCVISSSSAIALNLDQFAGVSLECSSSPGQMAQNSSVGCVLKFTGTPTTMISARSSASVVIRGIYILGSNAAFNGTVFDSSHVTSADSGHLQLVDNAIDMTATACTLGFNLDKTVISFIVHNHFMGCVRQARGAASAGSYSNANHYIQNQFDGGLGVSPTVLAISNPGQAADISYNTYEGNNAGLKVVSDEGGFASAAVGFEHNWIGDDTSSVTYNVVTIAGSGLHAVANYVAIVDANATLFSIGANASSIHISALNACGAATLGTFLSLGGSNGGVFASHGSCALTVTTFLSGAPVSGQVTDPTNKTQFYGTMVLPASVAIGAGAAITSSGSGGTVATITGIETLTNKTLTSPILGGTTVENRITVTGLSTPTCPTVTGAGASGICTVAANSTDSKGEITINAAGAGVAATGTMNITFSAPLGTNRALCFVFPSDNNTPWNARASFHQSSTITASCTLNWDNNAAALVAGNGYNVTYECFGR